MQLLVSLSESASGADLGDGSNIQKRTLKAEVGTAIGHGFVDPKREGCSAYASLASFLEREWGLTSPNQEVDSVR